MKVQVTIGREGSGDGGGGLWVPVLKLGAVGLVALVLLNRRDIRRYLRLRRM